MYRMSDETLTEAHVSEYVDWLLLTESRMREGLNSCNKTNESAGSVLTLLKNLANLHGKEYD